MGRYEAAFNHLRARTLDIPASREFLQDLIKEEE